MEKKTIRVCFADLSKDKQDCYGVIGEVKAKSLIYELLQKMYVLDERSEPDYVFTHVPVGDAKGFEYGKYKNAVWIFIQNENVFPDFFCFDYVIGYDFMLEYGDRYFCLPSMMAAPYTRQYYDKILSKHHNITEQYAKREFCAMTVSNGCNAAKERERIFRLLSEYKRVDSGGRFLNNIGGFAKDKYEFEAKHKFVIAIDNVENGWVQEKIGMAFAAKAVPIYWGNPAVTKVYNDKAFVNCHAFDSFEDVIKRVIEIDNDDELYLSMLREPALLHIEKTEAEYEEEICAFLRHIIEQPKEKAIRRRSENWMGIMQEMRLDGFKRLYRKRKLRHAVGKLCNAMFGEDYLNSAFMRRAREKALNALKLK